MENCSEKLGRNDLRERSRFDFNRDANSVGNLGVKVNLDISSKAYDQRVSNAPICAFKLRFVRRHINWNNHRPDLKEDLAHLVQDIKRRICGIASAGSPSFSV